jgi:hypothetical protein
MLDRNASQATVETAEEQGEIPLLKTYLEAVVSSLHGTTDSAPPGVVGAEQVPDRIFDVLTNREFCYLSKTRVAPYRAGVLAAVAEAQRRATPIHFFYDLGGGYHASTQPGHDDLSFDVGLAELLVLSQISTFAARAARFHPPGVKFSLVIDNMCALLINDIPLSSTLGYCGRFRSLIRELRFDDVVDVLVESEHISVDEFERVQARAAARPGPIEVTRKQHDNVERFLGRICDPAEAAERTRKYQAVIDASEQLLEPLITGVHMTQRATETTVCFRPFPGADSRIQCGEVVLTTNAKQKLYPILMTSSNRPDYICRRYRFPELLSPAIPHVTYAEPTTRGQAGSSAT